MDCAIHATSLIEMLAPSLSLAVISKNKTRRKGGKGCNYWMSNDTLAQRGGRREDIGIHRPPRSEGPRPLPCCVNVGAGNYNGGASSGGGKGPLNSTLCVCAEFLIPAVFSSFLLSGGANLFMPFWRSHVKKKEKQDCTQRRNLSFSS